MLETKQKDRERSRTKVNLLERERMVAAGKRKSGKEICRSGMSVQAPASEQIGEIRGERCGNTRKREREREGNRSMR